MLCLALENAPGNRFMKAATPRNGDTHQFVNDVAFAMMIFPVIMLPAYSSVNRALDFDLLV